MSMGRMSWEKPEIENDYWTNLNWFTETMTGSKFPYEVEVDEAIGPMFRMYWEQPREWRFYRPVSLRGSNK